MKKIKKVVALLSIVSLLIATAFLLPLLKQMPLMTRRQTMRLCFITKIKLYLLQARHNSHKMSTNALGQV